MVRRRKNWYEEVSNFQEDTIKIVYDENNIIVGITRDASTFNPEGFSVVEVPDITANRRADDSGKWMFKDGAVIKRIYTADEQQQQAESQRPRYFPKRKALFSHWSALSG